MTKLYSVCVYSFNNCSPYPDHKEILFVIEIDEDQKSKLGELIYTDIQTINNKCSQIFSDSDNSIYLNYPYLLDDEDILREIFKDIKMEICPDPKILLNFIGKDEVMFDIEPVKKVKFPCT